MDLLTVTNDVFAPCVFNLIESYKLNSSNNDIYVVYYDLKEEYLDLLKSSYGAQINLVKVEKECDHAYNSRFYFPKGYALKIAAAHSKEFVMCDASHAFLSQTYDLEYALEEDTRFFIEYPEPLFKNKHWASQRSLELTNCDTKEIRESQSYWSGFHAYVVTDENKEMLLDQYKFLLLKDVAGPSNLLKYPDGPDADCIGHRCDQTVLSLMIHKYGFRQPFDIGKYNRYGDIQTMEWLLPQIYERLDLSQVAMYSRYSKYNNFSFVKPELLNKIVEIAEIYKIDRNTGYLLSG